MSVYFSEKFKQLRKDKDLTQEEIAEIFHVSPQSVSRWETGANYPDVELLPHIAIYFKVTLDELLGTEKILGEEKVNEYIKDIRNLLNSGRLDDAVELARKAIKEYPLNTGLHFHLVQALSKVGSEKHKDEIIAISERIINLTDYKSSLGHRIQLIEHYVQCGMKEEAKKLLDTMPNEMWDSKEPWAHLVLDGKERQNDLILRIIRTKYLLYFFLAEYFGCADLDIMQKINLKKARRQIESLIDTITGQETVHLEVAFQNIGIAELYCEAGDIENALDYIEKATQDSMYHIEQMDKTNDDDGGNYMAWQTPRNLPWILWEDHLMKPQFDIVRNDERFVRCFELLKENSRELK